MKGQRMPLEEYQDQFGPSGNSELMERLHPGWKKNVLKEAVHLEGDGPIGAKCIAHLDNFDKLIIEVI